jgi:hypothetical protein
MHFYGIWSHFEALEVDKITWGVIFFLNLKRGALTAFSVGKRDEAPFF